MKRIILALILIQQLQAQSTLHLPRDFVIQQNLILTKAKINSVEGFFILDSGAPNLILNNRIFKNSAGPVSGQTLTGDCPFSSITAKNFEWKNITIKKVTALTIDLTHYEQLLNEQIIGLIGMDILKDHALLIDFSNDEVKLLENGGYLLSAMPDLSLPLIMNGDLVCLQVRLNGEKLLFGLDTGSKINIIQKGILPLKADQSLKQFKLTGLNQESQMVTARSEGGLQLNDRVLEAPMKYLMIDLREQFCPTPIQGIFGAPFFQQAKLLLDFKNEQIHFWFPTS